MRRLDPTLGHDLQASQLKFIETHEKLGKGVNMPHFQANRFLMLPGEQY